LGAGSGDGLWWKESFGEEFRWKVFVGTGKIRANLVEPLRLMLHWMHHASFGVDY
jgi:hypothetical protein